MLEQLKVLLLLFELLLLLLLLLFQLQLLELLELLELLNLLLGLWVWELRGSVRGSDISKAQLRRMQTLRHGLTVVVLSILASLMLVLHAARDSQRSKVGRGMLPSQPRMVVRLLVLVLVLLLPTCRLGKIPRCGRIQRRGAICQ